MRGDDDGDEDDIEAKEGAETWLRPKQKTVSFAPCRAS
jgi:hypothetical protein